MSPSEQTPSWRIRGRTGARQLKSLSLRAPHCSLGQHAAQLVLLQEQVRSPSGPESGPLGKKGQDSGHYGQGTRVPSVSHTEPTFFPAPDLSSRGSRGTLTSRESEASALSLWLLAHRSCPYTGLWGSGKRPGGLPQARGLDSRADKRLAQSSHRWALLSAGT